MKSKTFTIAAATLNVAAGTITVASAAGNTGDEGTVLVAGASTPAITGTYLLTVKDTGSTGNTYESAQFSVSCIGGPENGLEETITSAASGSSISIGDRGITQTFTEKKTLTLVFLQLAMKVVFI